MRVAVALGGTAGEFEIGDEKLVALEGGHRVREISDVVSDVAAALANPIDFPPLRQAVVPGDHITIAADGDVPQLNEILAALVEELVEAGVAITDISVLEVTWRERPAAVLSADQLPPGIRLIPHDAFDRRSLSYLASTRAGTRVYLNRELVDADFVLLVGRVDYHPILGYRGTASSVYPGLADESAQRVFRKGISEPRTRSSQQSERAEVDEVAWLLGVQFALQVVVGEGNAIVGVLAGGCREVQRQAQRLLNRSWHSSAPRRADLAIAMLGGDRHQQDFDSLGAVLETASRVVRDGGRIVVLSELDAVPGKALQMGIQMQNPLKALEQLQRQPLEDCISTWQILSTSQRFRVHLMSRLDDALVRKLGLLPISQLAELQRLIDDAGSCIWLPRAERAHVEVEKNHAKSDA